MREKQGPHDSRISQLRAKIVAKRVASQIKGQRDTSWELFQAQPRDYRDTVLGNAPRIAVEAAGKFGWTRYVDCEDDVIGMDGFGASGRAEDLYQSFGITRDAIIARAEVLVRREARK